jgi:hypothetical protein
VWEKTPSRRSKRPPPSPKVGRPSRAKTLGNNLAAYLLQCKMNLLLLGK